MGLQHLLLAATELGYSTWYLNQPIEVLDFHSLFFGDGTANGRLPAGTAQSGSRRRCDAFTATSVARSAALSELCFKR